MGGLFYCLNKIMLAQAVLCWYSALIEDVVGVEMKKFDGLKEAMLAVKAEMVVAEAKRMKERTVDDWLAEGGEFTVNKVKLTLENDKTRFDGVAVKKANWHVKSAVGVVFVHCRDRAKAQGVIDAVFGKGKYNVQSGGLYI